MKKQYYNKINIQLISAASYRGPSEYEDTNSYAARIALTGKSRILGPICIVVGALMLALGILLCMLTRRARKRERRVGFHCPLHGDFYPPHPVQDIKLLGEFQYTREYFIAFPFCLGGKLIGAFQRKFKEKKYD